jgi:hypothetical protein
MGIKYVKYNLSPVSITNSTPIQVKYVVEPFLLHIYIIYVCLLFTNGGTCLFDIVYSALWGSQYPVCTPDAQMLFLSGACMLHTQHSAVQTLPGGV